MLETEPLAPKAFVRATPVTNAGSSAGSGSAR